MRQTLVSRDGMKLGWKGEIVFDRVGRTHDLGLFTTDDRADHLDLHLKGQAGGKAVHVDFVRGDSFRFEENLLALLFRELDDFVLNGRTVARADPFDDAGIHGRFMEIGPNDPGRGVGGIGDVAGQLAVDLVKNGPRRILARIVPRGTNRLSNM